MHKNQVTYCPLTERDTKRERGGERKRERGRKGGDIGHSRTNVFMIASFADFCVCWKYLCNLLLSLICHEHVP